MIRNEKLKFFNMKYIYLLSTITLCVQFSFGQCDEYYINERISGTDEKCYFSNGSPIRFCPGLRGVSIDGNTFDTYQWDGISTQYITLSKGGGIVGTLVLKLKEREFVVNLNGCGKRTYSISFNKEEYNDYFRRKEIREREQQNKMASIKNEITEKINKNELIEAAAIFESNNVNDKNLFDLIQNRIFKIPINKQPNDNESFNILISKLGEEKLLKLSQGNYILSSDTISGLTLKDNNTNQIVKLSNEVLTEKIGAFDRINQFEKKLEFNKIISLHGVKLNTQWDGRLSNGSISMRFFKANKKGKTVILGGVKDIPPKKYTNVEIVPDGLKNISFDSKLDLKKGRFIFLYKIYLNGKESLVKTVEEQDIFDLDWFYF
jgi:hypothetical protein